MIPRWWKNVRRAGPDPTARTPVGKVYVWFEDAIDGFTRTAYVAERDLAALEAVTPEAVPPRPDPIAEARASGARSAREAIRDAIAAARATGLGASDLLDLIVDI